MSKLFVSLGFWGFGTFTKRFLTVPILVHYENGGMPHTRSENDKVFQEPSRRRSAPSVPSPKTFIIFGASAGAFAPGKSPWETTTVVASENSSQLEIFEGHSE